VNEVGIGVRMVKQRLTLSVMDCSSVHETLQLRCRCWRLIRSFVDFARESPVEDHMWWIQILRLWPSSILHCVLKPGQLLKRSDLAPRANRSSVISNFRGAWSMSFDAC